MIISCPSCGVSFSVNSEALGTEGRTVKCSKCAHQWRAMPETAAATDAPEPIPSPPPTADPDMPPPPDFDPAPASDAADAESDAPAASTDDASLDDILGAAGTLDQEPIADEAAPAIGTDATAETGPAEPAAPSAAVDAAGEDAPGDGDTAHGFPPPPSMLADELPEETVHAPKRGTGLAKVVSLVILVFLLTGVGVGGFFMQSKIVMWFPASSKIYAMVGLKPNVLGQGLQIIEPKPTKQIDGNDEILVVEGQISNTTAKQIMVPLMRAALLDKFGKVLHVWTFNAAKQEISPGESTDYATQFRNPPAAAERLDITFTRPGEGDSPVKPQVTPASVDKPPAN